MKLNKTFALAALVAGSLFTGNLAVQAQDSTNTPPASPRPRGLNIEAVTKQLDLTEDEKPKVKAVLDDLRQKMGDLRADTSLSTEDKRAKGKALREEENTKLKDILTPEQYTKWLKISQMHRRPVPTPPADSPATNAPAAN